MAGKTVLIGLLLAFLSAVAPQETASKLPQVQELAQQLASATLEGKFEQLIDLTYPAFVENLGGREEAIEVVRQGINQMQQAGFKMEEFKVGQPGEQRTEGEHLFVVLPTEVLMSSPRGKIKGQAYLLAISADAGKTWKFVDGNGLRQPSNRELLPKLPDDFQLPTIPQPELVPDKQ